MTNPIYDLRKMGVQGQALALIRSILSGDEDRAALISCFQWRETPEGEVFWADACDGDAHPDLWRPKLTAMVNQAAIRGVE